MRGPQTLGGSAVVGRHLLAALGHGDLALVAPDRTPLEDWADSGLMDLTRDAKGCPLRPRGVPATVARGAAAALCAVAASRFGRPPGDGRLDGAQLLAERAALSTTGAAALAIEPMASAGVRSALTSRGGRARFVSAADGWWVLHLARASDVGLVPALVEAELSAADDLDAAWEAVDRWAIERSAAEAVQRAVLLGLAASSPSETLAPTLPWSIVSGPASAPARARAPGRVVNLGALWAAPLAAQLLGEIGFEVLHVESADRPDASRWGDPGLHALLHRGADQVRLDFGSPSGRAQLLELVSSADVVIEASRPRALEGLGVARRDVLPDGRGRTWLQITGHGPGQPHRVGFGDDAAVAGGLVAEHEDGRPAFSGDALADPLTGLLGALAVAALHDPARTTHATISLAGAAAWCRAAGDPDWPVDLPAPSPPRHR